MEKLIKENKEDEAWVWLASITSNREERKNCHEEALRYNPRNQSALKALQKMGGSSLVMQSKNVPVTGHIPSGWPLILIFVGGAIGGALGGAAYYANLSIFKSTMPGAVKIVLNLIIGVAAFALWFIISLFIRQKLAQ